MPGDSTLIQIKDSLSLADSLQHVANVSSGQISDDHSGMIFLIFLGVVSFPFMYNFLHGRYTRKRNFRVAKQHRAQHDQLLSANNVYYNSLPATMRQRFLDRVLWFMSVKTFTCIDLEQDDRMALLISGASIQITFGLDKYLLDFFDTVYIMQHNYTYAGYSLPFEGHVNSNGIYLSWDNFLNGYRDYTDADNVGIHEMAHALAYVNFMAGANSGRDDRFIKRFQDFSAVARPVFDRMQQGEYGFLASYAATNYNEFWAVAVETFFEQSLQMKLQLPALYMAMCSLLNQDPLLPEKLLTIPDFVQV